MASNRPNTVSRYLKAQGFSRSTSHANRVVGGTTVYSGFEVAATDNGETLVTYTLGTSNPRMTPERRRELVSTCIHSMEKALSERYAVIMFEPAEGTNYTLRVL